MNTLSNYYVRVLSLRSSVINVFLTEPWHSCHVLFSCESSLRACLVSCWSVVFGSRHSCLEFRFRFGHSRSTFCLVVWACDLEFSRLHALLSTCVLLCCTQFVFLSAACIHVMSCAVWHAACVFIGCVLSCCDVLCEHVAYEFSLAACSCLVLHMAGELFAGHVRVFLFCVSTWLLS